MLNSTIISDEEFDRFLMFLSADAFMQYWSLLAGDNFSINDQNRIQVAARAEVDDFMGIEEVFWNIDFSKPRMANTKKTFLRNVEGLSAVDERALNNLMSHYCSDDRERKNVVFAISFLNRVTTESAFRERISLSSEQSDIVAACMESTADTVVDCYQIKRGWLLSETIWDKRLRSFTPDVPDYIFLNFSEAYQRRTELPLFLDNLCKLLGEKSSIEFVRNINRLLNESFPDDSGLKVPKLLQTFIAHRLPPDN